MELELQNNPRPPDFFEVQMDDYRRDLAAQTHERALAEGWLPSPPAPLARPDRCITVSHLRRIYDVHYRFYDSPGAAYWIEPLTGEVVGIACREDTFYSHGSAYPTAHVWVQNNLRGRWQWLYEFHGEMTRQWVARERVWAYGAEDNYADAAVAAVAAWNAHMMAELRTGPGVWVAAGYTRN